MRKILPAIIFFLSLSVNAESYHWKAISNNAFGPEFPTPSGACNWIKTQVPTITSITPTAISGDNGKCSYYFNAGSSSNPDIRGPYDDYVIRRFGNTCSDPTATLNPETGICEAPVDNCSDKAGQSTPVRRSGTRGDGYYSTVAAGGKTYGVTPPQGCYGGCEATVRNKCIFKLSTDTYSCIGEAIYTGQSCVAAPNNQLEESPTTDQREPQDSEVKEPCIYVQDAEGRNHCVSKDVVEKEGQNCGTYQGVSLCVPKQASTEEKKVETELKEETKPDGSKQIVKKDVATETKCEGDKTKCTTKTTTTTTTTNKDGSGTTTKTETTCSGANCGSTGGGGGGGSGNGSGEGDQEGEGGELPGNEDAPGFGESVQSFSSRVSGSPLMSAVSGISMPTGGSCNMPSATVPMIGSISFNWVCTNANLLDPLYYMMLAVWALGAVRIFMEA